MRILMVALGSTGDVRPYIGLGTELMKRGHTVTLCALPNFQELVQRYGLIFKPVAGDAKAFISDLMDGSTGLQFLNNARKALKDFIEPFIAEIEKYCDEQQLLITTYLGEVFQAIAEVKKIPYIQTQYFPMDQNRDMPISSAPGQNIGKAWNEMTYKIGNLLISMLERAYLSDWRRDSGLGKREIRSYRNYDINGRTIPVLYAISPTIVPRPSVWPENIQLTGYWRTPEQQEYTPSPQLLQFLQEGPTPIYIGFGSMSNKDLNKTMNIVLKSLKHTKQRAIIAKGWGDFKYKENSNLFFAEYIPHEWILPRVSAVVHHGGAGTTAAGLFAGKPTLIISFGGDQPFWGNRIHALGVGPAPIPRSHLTTYRLSRALTRLTSSHVYEQNARTISEKLNAENGIQTAADLIEQEMHSIQKDISGE